MTATKLSSTHHFNVIQLRIDLWNQLRTQLQFYQKEENKDIDSESNKSVSEILDDLAVIEQYYSFPGKKRVVKLQEFLKNEEFYTASARVNEIVRQLVSESYRSNPRLIKDDSEDENSGNESSYQKRKSGNKNHFEVLFLDNLSRQEETAMRSKMAELSEDDEHLSYDVVVQRSFQDALIALLLNYNIQAVVIRYAPPYASNNIESLLKPFLGYIHDLDFSTFSEEDLGPILGKIIKQFRPELDIYYVTDTALLQLKDSTVKNFRRIFYRKDDIQELHLAILRGIRERYKTPFFTALKEYSQKPVGVFHAMPISRGNSVFKSRWIRDFGQFYGRNLCLAETSSTTGGLDSLLQPTGSLKEAQMMASKAYGSKCTFFVTNGTSTSNKIVQQALVEPGDLVLIDRDCHKSHHYGLVLAGALPVYLDSYPIEKYSMYGAVPLEEIKHTLLELKKAGRLDKVKMLLLTNCTFDGLVYNVERVMEEVLAIKPDIIFLWDEAWFAFAGFTYTYKQRTGMFVANKLYQKYQSKGYREKYNNHIESLSDGELPSIPDPDKVKIRVYSTQSTHKTLSSFRQGSMIHIWDEEYRRLVSDSFQEAYMTHTSTSPNYQILASMDAGRRQVQFEGYEMVEKSIELAMSIRAKIHDHPLLHKYFRVLTVRDFIPDQYRKSGLDEYYTDDHGWNRMEDAWEHDEFVLDPTKITLAVGLSGIDGDTFKNEYLMDQYNIQINKTSRNSILFMTSIGTTRGSVAYLVNTLLQIAEKLDEEYPALNKKETEILQKRIKSLMEDVPPLPDFSWFHSSFQAVPGVPGGDIRQAYFLSYKSDNCEYIPLKECLNVIEGGRELVSTTFVIPYPPGFPVLVPGQVISKEIIKFLLALDVKEIHGYRPELGLKVFTEKILNYQEEIPARAERMSGEKA
ncbi:aminotransferase class I/II-fold pyridoxal phosphate-dependent enzyme [Rhodohalobacter sp. SW132]|uniref:aminotransferase class I/II-fold pyridoxal phosphate-dependent enzyme n=1 Tax=Rhodohalobacter sp. SW132 TaxID=2293433 RepID=UPI000E2308B8|nr:aminotransferase class I/II-fold pyridoxal phosphate-dependent enzyme [Rhodohalobacter sp. SW132]REL39018.1 aminotransferase class I/II-fold pyridoxal phosphate-dependent enzyme [Rhodohalobacter sp. SW132]